jgi:pSer/pThr/pTyr-binding forkhead associated (FHA) protein
MKLIIEDDEGHRTVIPVVRDELTIGRNDANMVRLTEKNVSRKHARLVREDGHFYIEDLNSFTGVRVNGEKVKGKHVVHEGDLIQISEYDLSLHSGPDEKAEGGSAGLGDEDDEATLVKKAKAEDPAKAENAAAEAKARKEADTAVIRLSDLPPIDSGTPAAEVAVGLRPKLVGVSGSYRGKELVLDRSPIRLGRAGGNDIEIDHPSVSKRHLRLHLDSGTWKVMDAESRNGVRVNGEPYAAIGLRHGDILEIGHLRFAFVAPGQAYKLPPEFGAMPGSPKASGGYRGIILGSLAFVALLVAGVWWFSRPKADDGVEVVQDSKHERKFALRAAEAAVASHHYTEALRHLDVARHAGATAAELRNYNEIQKEARSEDLYREMESAAAAQDFEKARKLLGVLTSSGTHFGGKAAEKAEGITAGYVNLHVASAALAKGKDNAACLSEAQLALQANPASADAQSLAEACKAPAPAAPAARAAAPSPRPERTPAPEKAVASAAIAKSPDRDSEARKLLNDGNLKLVGPPPDPAGAIALYQKAVALRPGDAVLGPAYRALGIAYARQGNVEEGARFYRLYLPLCSNPQEKAQLQKYLDQFDSQRK